jgi:hypothetical protein
LHAALGAELAVVDLSAPSGAIYGELAGTCQYDEKGATGDRYAPSALRQALLTLRDGVMFGDPALLPQTRVNGCLGSAVSTFT